MKKGTMERKVYLLLLLALPYLLLYYLNEVVLENYCLNKESVHFIKAIPMFMGGPSAFYFLCKAKSSLSKGSALYSFLLSDLYIFVVNYVPHIGGDTAILIVICVLTSFLISWCCISDTICIEKQPFDFLFIIILIARLFLVVSPEIKLALVLELIFLFVLLAKDNPKEYYREKRRIFFCLLFSFCVLSLVYIHKLNLAYIAVLAIAIAGAGGMNFLFFCKTDQGKIQSLLLYILNNILLGFYLRKEGETFPQILIFFLSAILFWFIFIWLISQIKGESLLATLDKTKTELVGIFLPILFLLNSLFLQSSSDDLITLWFNSLAIQTPFLGLLSFILEKEDGAKIKIQIEKGMGRIEY